jgi:hypothetical protein
MSLEIYRDIPEKGVYLSKSNGQFHDKKLQLFGMICSVTSPDKYMSKEMKQSKKESNCLMAREKLDV